MEWSAILNHATLIPPPSNARPPIPLDRAVTFAPVGTVVVSALASLRKGGVVAINAIHLDRMPAFDYDTLLWGERQLRSVANMTRQDARDFLALARDIGLRPRLRPFPLSRPTAPSPLSSTKPKAARRLLFFRAARDRISRIRGTLILRMRPFTPACETHS